MNTTMKSLLLSAAIVLSADVLGAQRTPRTLRQAARVSTRGLRPGARPLVGLRAQRRLIRAELRAGRITPMQAKRQLRRARQTQRIRMAPRVP